MLTSRQQLSLGIPGALTLAPCPAGDTLLPPQRVQPGEAPPLSPASQSPIPEGWVSTPARQGTSRCTVQAHLIGVPPANIQP